MKALQNILQGFRFWAFTDPQRTAFSNYIYYTKSIASVCY